MSNLHKFRINNKTTVEDLSTLGKVINLSTLVSSGAEPIYDIIYATLFNESHPKRYAMCANCTLKSVDKCLKTLDENIEVLHENDATFDIVTLFITVTLEDDTSITNTLYLDVLHHRVGFNLYDMIAAPNGFQDFGSDLIITIGSMLYVESGENLTEAFDVVTRSADEALLITPNMKRDPDCIDCSEED